MSRSAFLFSRGLQGVKAEARGVAAAFARDDLAIETRTPDAQLLDRSGAKCVAGRQHHLQSVISGKFGRELTNRRRLARAVDADDQDDEGPLASVDFEWLGERVEHGLDFGRENVLHFVGADVFVVAAFGDRLGDPQRRRGAEIGADQHILKLLQRVRVELPLRENIIDAAANGLR